ncbi:hypothetical protein ABVK25_006998 [Lepraria finkii]|uniref:Uncharacterized protein n=1 Tax=Lepraria finkii TaxID=1340010 RepID=A0ABR4B5T0_9LECA
MATTFPRYSFIISRTLDPLFALLIGISAAGIRIRREENEKRAGMVTTSMVQPTAVARKPTNSAGGAGGKEEGEVVGEIGYAEIARMGWVRVRRRVFSEEKEG